jgi:hypothetical protein
VQGVGEVAETGGEKQLEAGVNLVFKSRVLQEVERGCQATQDFVQLFLVYLQNITPNYNVYSVSLGHDLG